MRVIYTCTDHILTLTDDSQPALHQHFMKHIALSFGSAIEFSIDGHTFPSKGVIINSNVLHTINCKEQKHLILLIDETSDLSQKIDKFYLKGRSWCEISDEAVSLFQSSSLFTTSSYIKETYLHDFNALLQLLHLDGLIKNPTDPRILGLIDYLKKQPSIDEHIIPKLLERAHLSQPRLSHLFHLETGTSLSSYLAFIKTVKASEYLLAGDSITIAALKAGFSSSNHFAGTAKRMMGFSGSQLNSDSILISFS